MPPDPVEARSLPDQSACTTADCGRLAVRMVEIEDLGEHPYCYFCAAALDPQKLGDEIDRLRAENGRLRSLCERAVDALRYEANPVCDEWDAEFAGASDEQEVTG